jgi:hypothetical protein
MEVTMPTAGHSLTTSKQRTNLGGDRIVLYRVLSITDERIAILIAFLGFLQQVVWLLWKLLASGHL